jgi:hypothetical protein
MRETARREAQAALAGEDEKHDESSGFRDAAL